MNAKDIRQKFLDFFKSKGHEIVNSAPLVVKDDPTLMFTNAGMNQFKDYFLGNKKADSPKVANSQKCLRVSGKHNDLEEVGIDTYHHTMFEMLGNWSFGDYFKKEAIDWAWELLVEGYGLPKDRLYATIFEGDSSENLERDQEAFDMWAQYLPNDKILNGSKKDNFWEMGDTGPCGPCSELHIDLRSDEEIAAKPGRELVNMDHPQVIEIWNLVFIQYNRKADNSLENLPDKHVDTGMGFERLAMAIQGKTSNYDTDVFQPLIQFLAKKADVKYGESEQLDIALRVISDHVRAIAFAITDGQLPSNNKAGYVIRRILRRAVRYGYTFLNFDRPFIYELVPILSEQMGDFFTGIREQESFVMKVIQEEESAFLRTLEKGLKLFEQIKENTKGKTISGQQVFELYDTFGFPVDLTALIAREQGFEIDEKGFEEAMKVQKERSREDAQSSKGDWTVVHDASEKGFVGYDSLHAESRILRYRKVEEKKKTFYQLVLEQTPFYAEGGGQVGDRGYIDCGEEKVSIVNTIKENDLFIHIVKKLPKNLDATFSCQVSEKLRRLTENNHSATHLVHAALKEVLGEHVNQKGSLVNEDLLRFDFSHFTKVTEEELAQIEQIVNQKIRQNIQLDEKRSIAIDEAKALGATALFGEKYGDFVRVITFDPEYSIELCGGTHVSATGQIGFFKITSESSVAAGVRRIEAITADKAESYINKELDRLANINELLKSPKDLVKAVEKMIEEKAQLQKTLEGYELEAAQREKDRVFNMVESVNGVDFIAAKVNLPNADSLRQLAFDLRNKYNRLWMVLAAEFNGKPQIAVMFSEEVMNEKDVHAGKMVKELARAIKGGGGGQPFFATAGGKDASGIPTALENARKMLEEIVTA